MVYTKRMSVFDEIVTAAVEDLLQLRRLEGMKKLSADGFVQQAIDVSGASAERLGEICAMLEARGGVLLTSMRRLSAFFSGPHAPCMPLGEKLNRLWRHECMEGSDLELTNACLSMREVVAAAVLHSTIRFGERFGQIDNWMEHQAEVARLRNRLQDAEHRMRNSYGAHDLIVHRDPLPDLDISSVNFNDPKQVDAYYREKHAREVASRNPEVGPWLRRCPQVSLAAPDWPSKLLTSLLSNDPVGAIDAAKARAETDQLYSEQKKKMVKSKKRKGPPSRRVVVKHDAAA